MSATLPQRAHKRSGPSLRPNVAGVGGGIELALRFVLWAQQLRAEPTTAQIQARFNLSRAAAYRWSRSWHAARGAVASTKEHTT